MKKAYFSLTAFQTDSGIAYYMESQQDSAHAILF